MTRAHRAPAGVKETLAKWGMEYVLEYCDRDRFEDMCCGGAYLQIENGTRLIPTGCGTGLKIHPKVGGKYMSPFYVPFE